MEKSYRLIKLTGTPCISEKHEKRFEDIEVDWQEFSNEESSTTESNDESKSLTDQLGFSPGQNQNNQQSYISAVPSPFHDASSNQIALGYGFTGQLPRLADAGTNLGNSSKKQL